MGKFYLGFIAILLILCLSGVLPLSTPLLTIIITTAVVLLLIYSIVVTFLFDYLAKDYKKYRLKYELSQDDATNLTKIVSRS